MNSINDFFFFQKLKFSLINHQKLNINVAHKKYLNLDIYPVEIFLSSFKSA